MSCLHKYPYNRAKFTYQPGPFRGVWESELGGEVWRLLTLPHNVHALVVAVRLRAAPAAAVAEELLAAFAVGDVKVEVDAKERMQAGIDLRHPGQTPPTADQFKRMVGHMIRQILKELGAKVRTKNTSARDATGLFTTSARYAWEDEATRG